MDCFAEGSGRPFRATDAQCPLAYDMSNQAMQEWRGGDSISLDFESGQSEPSDPWRSARLQVPAAMPSFRGHTEAAIPERQAGLRKGTRS
jgi:hypothetical protein